MKSGDARVVMIGFPSVGKVCPLKHVHPYIIQSQTIHKLFPSLLYSPLCSTVSPPRTVRVPLMSSQHSHAYLEL